MTSPPLPLLNCFEPLCFRVICGLFGVLMLLGTLVEKFEVLSTSSKASRSASTAGLDESQRSRQNNPFCRPRGNSETVPLLNGVQSGNSPAPSSGQLQYDFNKGKWREAYCAFLEEHSCCTYSNRQITMLLMLFFVVVLVCVFVVVVVCCCLLLLVVVVGGGGGVVVVVVVCCCLHNSVLAVVVFAVGVVSVAADTWCYFLSVSGNRSWYLLGFFVFLQGNHLSFNSSSASRWSGTLAIFWTRAFHLVPSRPFMEYASSASCGLFSDIATSSRCQLSVSRPFRRVLIVFGGRTFLISCTSEMIEGEGCEVQSFLWQ